MGDIIGVVKQRIDIIWASTGQKPDYLTISQFEMDLIKKFFDGASPKTPFPVREDVTLYGVKIKVDQEHSTPPKTDKLVELIEKYHNSDMMTTNDFAKSGWEFIEGLVPEREDNAVYLPSWRQGHNDCASKIKQNISKAKGE